MTAFHYTRRGSGEPVVLVHGIGHSGRAWEPVSTLLAESYDVIAVDWGQVLHDGSFRHRKGSAPGVPSTIAWGSRDLILLPTQARRARRRLADVQHVRLPRCGHCPMLDDPEAVVRVVTSTFARAA